MYQYKLHIYGFLFRKNFWVKWYISGVHIYMRVKIFCEPKIKLNCGSIH